MELLKPILDNDTLISKIDFDFALQLKRMIPSFDFNYFSPIKDIDTLIDEMVPHNKLFGTVT